jgi:glycosyltransferase involved in cell wall biosynthesis
VSVSGIFVVTGPAEVGLLSTSLPALLPQVDELVVVANGARSTPTELPAGVRVVENEHPLGFSANVNKGIAATTGEYVVISNPDAVPEDGCISELAAFADDKGANALANKLRAANPFNAATGGFVTGPTAIDGLVTAIKRAHGSLVGSKLAAVMEKFNKVPTLSGNVSFSKKLHTVFGREYREVEINNNKPIAKGTIVAKKVPNSPDS